MASPSLQDGIDRAGSPVKLLWKPNAAPWTPEVVAREYAGWREEQAAWHEGVALLNLSHHMYDMFIEGPDATRLLADLSANNFENFAVGQAKQYIPVTRDGNIVTDGILSRDAENTYTLSGIPTAQHWVRYHGEQGGYDVTYVTDPSSAFRKSGDPKLFRYQIQGPLASELVERAFGGPLPPTKFFHSSPVTLDGRDFRALRHGMAGQAGYEFIGAWEHAEAVREALLRAGEPFGLVQVGALAYATPSVESGWVPSPVPGIYSDPELLAYRRHIALYGIEGQRPLGGSFFSENIEDYYCSPYELGYGKMISFNHDFIGRDALRKAKDEVLRKKVTLVFDADDVRKALGDDPGFVLSYSRHRVESRSGLVGITCQSASIDPVGTVLSLTLIDQRYAEPGTEVSVVWGEHPGPGTAPNANLGFPRIRATVQPAPFNQHARTLYRRDA
ncbi:Glycine cleavage system T protein (aminomethyltransferase) [Streptomyces sp. OV198]|uniref:aminomethyltransferase family protein n=1 Tax=Streptomyces sp. OV198 TaxID=1882787 RepID=UPI000BC8E55C|nr:aminomethyltransferase family protein [Streptomyces sp. OV198]SOE79074.1 Glycine cleavage system T protein (aminomethyltransferase) [Streptomyces sp. OV198]